MIPLLLVTDDEKEALKYVSAIKTKQKVQNAYVFTIKKEGLQLKIEQIRDIVQQMHSLYSIATIAYISDFETAKLDAQNMLLKSLEESPPLTQFIIKTTDEASVISTIISRSKVVTLKKKESKTIEFDFAKNLGDLLLEYDGMQKNATKATALCDALLHYYRALLHSQAKQKKINKKLLPLIDEVLKTRNLMLKNNINPQLAIDHVLIFVRRSF